MALSVTGQRGVSNTSKVALTGAPIIDEVDLLNPDHYINQRYLSGKQLGAQVLVRRGDGKLELAIAKGDKPTDTWDVHTVPIIPSPTKAGVDVYNWIGAQTISKGSYFNFLTLADLTKDIDGEVSTLESGIMKLPAMEEQSLVQFTIRMTGTTADTTPMDWRIQTRRPTDEVMSSVMTSRIQPQLSISNREAFLSSYTNGETDPFSVSGFNIGIVIPDAFQDIELTALTIRVGRIPN